MNKKTEAIIDVLEELKGDLEWRSKKFIDNKDSCKKMGDNEAAEVFEMVNEGLSIGIRYINEKIEYLKIPLKSQKQLAEIFPELYLEKKLKKQCTPSRKKSKE